MDNLKLTNTILGLQLQQFAGAGEIRYSALMDEKLRSILVTAETGAVPIFNTKHEGNVKSGSVKVPVRGKANLRPYDRGTGIDPEQVPTTYMTITDFKDVAINEIIDGYEAEQVPDNIIADRLDEASYAGALELDTKGIEVLQAEGTSIQFPSGTSIYEKIVAARAQLTKNQVPLTQRWLIVSPEVAGELLLDDRFIKQSDMSQTIVQTGVIGQVAGFTVYESNNVGAGMDNVDFIAGHSAWAHRIRDWIVTPYVANLVNDSRYIGASAVQGRWVYSHKVSKPETILVAGE